MPILPLFGALLATAGVASAQDCEEPYDINAFLGGLTRAEEALGNGNMALTEEQVAELYERAPCLREQVHPRHLVRFGRVRALQAHRLAREPEVVYWGQLALLDRTVPWPAPLEGETELQELLAVMGRRAPITLEGRGLEIVEGGGLLVDGTAVTRPQASSDAPHLLQILSPDGHIVETSWQDGDVWPEALLNYDPTPLTLPIRYAAPNPHLDPYETVPLTRREAERRESERMMAEEARAEVEDRLAEALELEKAAARKRRRSLREPTFASAPTEGAAAVSPVPIYIETDLGRVDAIERAVDPQLCAELLRLEARSIVGRLTDDQLSCLRARLATAPRQTTRSRISRALLADAWAKGDTDRWEAAVVRHLEEIDRSDPTLSLILATWLAAKESGRFEEAIRWAEVARENAHEWEGELRVERMSSLHRIDTMAASALWLEAEAVALESPTEQAELEAGYWRDQTKNLAREWLQFLHDTDQNPQEAFETCLSASGTAEYCAIR